MDSGATSHHHTSRVWCDKVRARGFVRCGCTYGAEIELVRLSRCSNDDAFETGRHDKRLCHVLSCDRLDANDGTRQGVITPRVQAVGLIIVRYRSFFVPPATLVCHAIRRQCEQPNRMTTE